MALPAAIGSIYDERPLLWIYEHIRDGDGVCSAHTRRQRSVQRVYFFGGEILRSFITLTTPSVSFASRSASALACSFGTVPFR